MCITRKPSEVMEPCLRPTPVRRARARTNFRSLGRRGWQARQPSGDRSKFKARSHFTAVEAEEEHEDSAEESEPPPFAWIVIAADESESEDEDWYNVDKPHMFCDNVQTVIDPE